MKKTKEKKYRICVYLVKESYANLKNFIKNPSELNSYSFKNRKKGNITLYIKPARPNKPSWIKLFENQVEGAIENIFNSSGSAVLITKHSNRYFVLTFGYGKSILNPNCIEESFGLKVALNTINADKIRSIDTKNLDTVLRHTRIQTSQATSVSDFGMNVDKDILNAVTGESKDETLGSRIAGSIALYLSIPLTMDSLDRLCQRLLEKYSDESYKERFPWVDHIKEVRNPEFVDALDKHFIDAIKEKQYESIFLSLPEIVDWENIEGFKYALSDELREDIYITDILPPESEIDNVTTEWLKRKNILCIGRASERPIYKWSVYKCINFEFEDKQETFVLTGGKWFKVDTNFVNFINTELSNVPEYTKFTFPVYTEKDEEAYNKKVYNDNKENCILMDKKNISHGGGRSKIEFCDLIIDKADFVHIKRFRGSTALSHLFFQGFNSAFLFLSDTTFREKVNTFLPTGYAFPVVGNIDSSKYEIVYAIISKSSKKPIEILPFFSKISLMQIYKQLRMYMFKVSLAKIKI